MWKRDFPSEGRSPDQHDAYCMAAWLRQADLGGRLPGFLTPKLTAPERAVADVEVGIEGWILGVG